MAPTPDEVVVLRLVGGLQGSQGVHLSRVGDCLSGGDKSALRENLGTIAEP
jgi:hypothetical protein